MTGLLESIVFTLVALNAMPSTETMLPGTVTVAVVITSEAFNEECGHNVATRTASELSQRLDHLRPAVTAAPPSPFFRPQCRCYVIDVDTTAMPTLRATCSCKDKTRSREYFIPNATWTLQPGACEKDLERHLKELRQLVLSFINDTVLDPSFSPLATPWFQDCTMLGGGIYEFVIDCQQDCPLPQSPIVEYVLERVVDESRSRFIPTVIHSGDSLALKEVELDPTHYFPKICTQPDEESLRFRYQFEESSEITVLFREVSSTPGMAPSTFKL